MKIRPKVPVCTDCDHVFEYKGREPRSARRRGGAVWRILLHEEEKAAP